MFLVFAHASALAFFGHATPVALRSPNTRALVEYEQLADTTDVQQFLQASTPLASQVLFLSPLKAMTQFREAGTGDATALPYAAMVVNGAAWIGYGALTSPAPDMTILLSNVGGVLFGLYYCLTFSRHMSALSDAPRLFTGAVVIVGMLLAAVISLPAELARDVLGYAGVGFSVLMFSGPLASVQAILRDCSAKSLPIGFTIATVVNCALWCAYGMWVIDDPLVWGPNVAGLMASVTQIALYGKFGENEDGCALYY